jgi:hypothetical protein
MKNLLLSHEDIDELENIYTQADADGKETFKFKGQTWYTDYGKYMLQYLKERFNEKMD